MALLRAEIKRGFLRCLFRSAPSAANSLSDVLASFQTDGFNAIKSGKLIIGTSGAGYSVNFKPPAIGDQFTQDEVFALSEEFIQIYSDVRASLVSAAGTDPSDQQIFDAMLLDDRLQAITSFRQDYTLLNFPSYR